MVKYHAHRPARTLDTVQDYIREYPAHWELMKWYKCWRKYPYPSEIVATMMAEVREEEYAAYPCPIDPMHWHVGRGGNRANPRKLAERAKRAYRKAVRDEILAEYEERAREVVRKEEQDV